MTTIAYILRQAHSVLVKTALACLSRMRQLRLNSCPLGPPSEMCDLVGDLGPPPPKISSLEIARPECHRGLWDVGLRSASQLPGVSLRQRQSAADSESTPAGRQRQASKPASRQAGKPASRQARKPASWQAGKPASWQAGKPALSGAGSGLDQAAVQGRGPSSRSLRPCSTPRCPVWPPPCGACFDTSAHPGARARRGPYAPPPESKLVPLPECLLGLAACFCMRVRIPRSVLPDRLGPLPNSGPAERQADRDRQWRAGLYKGVQGVYTIQTCAVCVCTYIHKVREGKIRLGKCR